MPELPEVETVRRGLAAHLLGQTLDHITVHRRALRIAIPDDFETRMQGTTLLKLTRRAKYLLFHMDNGWVMLVHLGMSGSFVLKHASHAELRTHDHVVFEWSGGWKLYFHDPRRFGLITMVEKQALKTHRFFAELGPEPFSTTLTPKTFHALLAGSAPIKTVIMDQHKLVGVGNIYACEALFESRILPTRKASSVTLKQAGLLLAAIRAVLKSAIASGGSTLRDYVRSSGDAGYFQHHFKVYGRTGKPCLRCGNPILVARQTGRSTFYCGHCQC